MVNIKKVDVYKPGEQVTMSQVLDCLREDNGYVDVGATAGFTGIVRGLSREGQPLSKISMTAEPDSLEILQTISKETEDKSDIVQQCAIHIHTGEIAISEPLMLVFIAGSQGPKRVPELFDILVATINRVKKEGKIRLFETTTEGEEYLTKPKDKSKSFD